MRKTPSVPVGEGCRVTKSKVGRGAKLPSGVTPMRCETHFWLYLNTCLMCGEKFHTDKPQTKTCSNRCRMALSRSRRFDKTYQLIMNFAEGVKQA